MTDPLVSTAWLAEHLGDKDLRLLDASWFLPAEGRSGHAEYLQRHIKGAVFFDIDAISDHSTDLPHMLPTPEAFAEAAGKLGLSREGTIVIYDSWGVRAAARVWWTLRVMGFDNVRVLDGGLKAWLAEGRPTEAGEVTPAPTTVTPKFRPELVRDVEAVKGLISSRAAQLVDARGGPRFRGEAPEPRPGLRSGHMPGALNVPFDSLINSQGRMRSAAELQAIFEVCDVDLGKPIVTTCGSGVTASVLALGLARLGLDKTPVYDGSWSEWGGRSDTPVETDL
ncbi:3-mercaptopyruvate sulfurtransferase [Phenylobacterium aquaticum]|uniref:3-mercaptopyruvate sulfurtransferase n=1 Tax=Phenylobacterium aquaticum TaxID=1763816 RepID=UPI001F5E33DC|nr:3-mercaptopyruvate sulfurtransferase [Phenylobacterium aquaticum]MCI3133088.1 3-mercaptopyruvate sulfurtransferase [Phenylobacterium aquaticum]